MEGKYIWDLEKYRLNTAIIDELGKKYSYQWVSEQCYEIVSQIGKRCLVMSFCTNTVGSLLGYVAFVNNGIVPIMVSAELDGELTASLSEEYRPQYYWIPVERQAVVKGSKVFAAHGYVLIRSTYDTEFPLFDKLALLLTTSGSTGSPKLVRQSYENIRVNMQSIARYLRLDETERPITTLQMNYTYGISIINSHLLVGASLIITSKTLMQREFWQQFKEYGATSFGGVPYTYEMLDKLRFFRMELPTLRTMTQAGGKLSQELHKKFAEYAQSTGRNFVVMYGQTEATARMAYLPPDKAVTKCGSMGIAIPGGKFRLVDDNGVEIKTVDTVGELIYEGANVTLGYAEKGEDLIKGDERNGVLATGDMAKQDEDGYSYIVGRKKRFLKIFGSRVNLDETERLLKSRFTDIDIACGGIDDKMYIFIASDEGAESIKRFLVEKLNFHSSAFETVYVDSIPRNASGKILYSSLSKYYQS